MISNRYAKANNKYMKDYNKDEKTSHIMYLDANNLYGTAMSSKLPYKNFRWMAYPDIQNWKNISCSPEVDLEYPNELHDLHNDYPLAPEHLNDKLIPNLNNKTNM